VKWLDDLFEYIDPFDPEFRFRVKGASDEEIDRLKEVMAAPLPQVHQEFLRCMGRDDGGFFVDSRAQTSVAAILELIGYIREENPEADFKTFVPIAIGDVFEGWALRQQSGELPVVLIDQSRPGGYVARSLSHLAFSTAFGWRIKAAAHQVDFMIRDDQTRLVQLSERAASLGFTPEWFCDHLSYFGVAPDSLLLIYSGSVRGFDGFVASHDLAVASRLAKAIVEPFGGTITSTR
jgi:hypothetical protein